MDKKKMTADNYDELWEIVKAVRNGEDPDIDKIREEQRRKREEQILERRKKKSGGSADSAGPGRASAKKQKKDGAGDTAPEDTQESKAGGPEAENAADNFSRTRSDPGKVSAGRSMGQGEKPEAEDARRNEDETRDKPEEESRWEKIRQRWERWETSLGRAEREPDGEESDEESDGKEPEGGEEPDEESDGKKPDSGEEPDEESDEDEARGEDTAPDEDDFDDDEFEKLLDEDDTEEEFIKSKETVTALTSKAAELLGGLIQKAEGAAARGREKIRKRAEDSEDSLKDTLPDDKSAAKKADSQKSREPVRDPGSERARLRSLERSLSGWNSDDDEPDDDSVYRPGAEIRKEESLKNSEPQEKVSDRSYTDAPDIQKEKLSSESGERKRERLSSESGERRQERLSSEPEERKRERLSQEPEDGEDSLRKEKQSRRTGRPGRVRGTSGRQKRAGVRLPEKISELLHAAGDRILSGWNTLNQRGIHKREMAMLGIVLLFILLILFFIITAARNFFGQKQKSRNVTAESGLTVTVEDEPQEWTSSYPVRLKILYRTGSVSSVNINGTACTPDENGMITLETDDWRLQAQVKTDDGVKKAQIEIPMLDGEAPVLDIEREKDNIVLSAADARSQVAGIYYAIEDPDKYSRLPSYQKYKEPLKYEKGMIYRFFAKDRAGNVSTPVVSTLEDAESFTLGKTKTALFPGETFSLSVEASPAGALLRNLKFESLDTSVAVVEENGKVTAVGEGTTDIRVSADGMESQTCTVDVGTERSVLVSAVGDCTLGTDESFNTSTSFNAFDSVNGHDYFFRNVKDILGKDDVTFANFEGTLTDSTAREAKQFAFKGDPSYTEILKDGSVEVVTLANNHSRDYGDQSLEDTKEAMKEADIDYCIGDEIAMREVNGVQVAFIGIYVLDAGLEVQPQVVQTITQARQLGAQIVIVAFHWGSEKATAPDETQRSLAHTAIDRGADLVVGHHPHVLQGIEQYNGKYIVYSLANFCFGGNSSPSDMDTMIFQQKFTVGQDGAVKNGEISIIPCSISSESGYNNYQPTPVSGSEAERIIGRLNEYSEEFGQTYEAAGE